MKVLNLSQVPAELLTDPDFSGGKVTRQTLAGPEKGRTLSAFLVTFSKGARNPLHTHTSDQIIIPTAGKGIVATKDEERVVIPGDVVIFAASEKHWHGATRDSDFSHIYVMSAGYKTEVVRG